MGVFNSRTLNHAIQICRTKRGLLVASGDPRSQCPISSTISENFPTMILKSGEILMLSNKNDLVSRIKTFMRSNSNSARLVIFRAMFPSLMLAKEKDRQHLYIFLSLFYFYEVNFFLMLTCLRPRMSDSMRVEIALQKIGDSCCKLSSPLIQSYSIVKICTCHVLFSIWSYL